MDSASPVSPICANVDDDSWNKIYEVLPKFVHQFKLSRTSRHGCGWASNQQQQQNRSYTVDYFNDRYWLIWTVFVGRISFI